MSKAPYTIDVLMAELRHAWKTLNVSSEDYARALAAQERPTIHFNTLRKLDDPAWMPSATILRDLEEVLIRNPLDVSTLRPRQVRRPRRDSQAKAATHSPNLQPTV